MNILNILRLVCDSFPLGDELYCLDLCPQVCEYLFYFQDEIWILRDFL